MHLKQLPNYYNFNNFKETVFCSKTQRLTAIHSNKQRGGKNESGKSFDLIVKEEGKQPETSPKNSLEPCFEPALSRGS